MIKKMLVVILISAMSFIACSKEVMTNEGIEGNGLCKFDLANQVIENFNVMYPDVQITSDEIIVDERTRTTIKVTDDIFYEISKDDGGPIFSIGGYDYLNVYNREFLFGYARALSDASFHFKSFDSTFNDSSNDNIDFQQAFFQQDFPSSFFEWSQGDEKISYHESWEPSSKDGLKYTMILTIHSNVVKYMK